MSETAPITPPPVPLPPPVAPRRRGAPRWVIALAIGVPLLIVVGIVGLFGFLNARQAAYRRLAATLPGELAAAKAQGLPLTPADLRPKPPIPDRQNAAPLYVEATRLWHKVRDSRPKDADPYAYLKPEKRTPANRAIAQKALQEEAAIIRLGERGAALPHCVFDRQWEKGAAVEFPEYAAMREIARLLAMRAILAKEDGHPDAALRDVATAAKIGVHCGEDPTFIGLLVRIAIHAIVNRPFVEVLQQYGDRADVRKLAAQVEPAFGAAPKTRHMIGAELVMERMIVEGIRRQPNSTEELLKGLAPPGTSEAQKRMMADAWESRFVNFWRTCDQALAPVRGDLYQERPVMERLCVAEQGKWKDAGYELNAVLIPVFDKVVVKEQQSEAVRRLRLAAEALLARRAATGRFPDSLAEIPGLPLDPFSDTSFLYQKTDKGFVVYSVGKDQKDDGGDDKTKDENGFTSDIALRYPS